MSKYSKHKIFAYLHRKNKEWQFDPVGGWYKISSDDLNEEIFFENNIKYNKTPLIFDKINPKWAKKNAKKYQNKLNKFLIPSVKERKPLLVILGQNDIFKILIFGK